MKKLSIYMLFLLIVVNLQAQTVNQGILKVSSNTVTSFLFPFSNQENGRVTNDGLTYFYSDFNNDGIYSIGKNIKTGKAVFTRLESQNGTQTLSGNAFTEFYNIDFNNPEPFMAFDLKSNIDVYGTVDFQNGIIKVDSTLNEKTGLSRGILSFHRGAKSINASHNSHVEGEVEKIGNDAFTFPIGDQGLYRPARITAPKTTKDAFVSKYILDDKTFFKTNKDKSGVINLLNDREYWIVEKGGNVSGDIMLTLSWDERTTPNSLLGNPEEELHIVRWDKEQQLWVDEGGVADTSVKEITTPATVKGYGVFTLGTVKKDWILEGDVVIYNLVTPDNDGKNDYFIIENINRFPNNKVEIYNRWGGRVYETTNYNSRDNVFRGYSDGRVTVNKGSKLPTGTYFYIVTYEYKNENGSRMIKKSGYLHLENN
ncbi:gliding motility-associated C-terminal domain-containing protein [Myroides indicus]|uniref:Gliding motility-associated-like protein n=1 Tax=Myroides indicus TaxID=1323422 RepID=A0A4R7F4M5_9FLAO|nr:gliding motility-associated C-terminal domain-containing protein [Myroides indicus]TDS63617.1 gliding motility-associated-like protein [Myroides indicus]